MKAKGKTVGKLARWLRRNVQPSLTYEQSVAAALGHFKASGAVGQRKLLGSRLTYDYAPQKKIHNGRFWA